MVKSKTAQNRLKTAREAIIGRNLQKSPSRPNLTVKVAQKRASENQSRVTITEKKAQL